MKITMKLLQDKKIKNNFLSFTTKILRNKVQLVMSRPNTRILETKLKWLAKIWIYIVNFCKAIPGYIFSSGIVLNIAGLFQYDDEVINYPQTVKIVHMLRSVDASHFRCSLFKESCPNSRHEVLIKYWCFHQCFTSVSLVQNMEPITTFVIN